MPLQQNSYNVLFIGQNDLVNNGVIESNVDTTIIDTIIKLVQDQWLQEVIGTNFMVDLQGKKASGSLNTNEQGLLDMYISPVMIWYCTYELSFFNTYKIRVKGLQKMSGDSSQAASLSEIQSFQNKTKERAEFYAQRLIRYLESNNLFPAYYQSGTTIADMQPIRRSGYQSSMYLGRDSNYSDYRRGSTYGDWFFEHY